MEGSFNSDKAFAGDPLVSVWIVAYNHERFIRQCLASVLMQKTNFRFEVIIGEDRSTDGTRSVIEEFKKKYPEIIKPIYHEKNVGAYRNAYEYCYPQLKGKYIACLEADDYWTDENKLQLQADALANDAEATMCFTRVELLNDTNNSLEEHWSTAYNSKQRYSVTDILKKFNIVTCTIMFRNIYPELPYNPSDFPTGDVSLSVFLLLKGHAIYINKSTAVYRIHDSGIFSPHTLEQKNLVFVKIFQQFLKHPLLKTHTRLLEVLLADRAYQAFCFEIKKPVPDKVKMAEYYYLSINSLSINNLFFPVKAMLRKAVYNFTGRSFGRKI